jgi:hypothetical protein
VRRALLLAPLLLLVASACGQTAANGGTPRAASGATPPPVAAGNAAAWQLKGATQVPPASLADVSMGSVQVVDQTGGAVSQSDAERWALAYLRGNAYEFWAWNHLQDGFLQKAQLSPVPYSVFSYDLSTIRDARAANMQLSVTRLALRRLVLRPVPASARGLIQAQAMIYTPYAFYLDQVGPSELDWVSAQGTKTPKARKDAGVGAPELVGGQLTTDPLMGDIWSADSDFDCTAPNVRQAFGTLCDQ